MSKNNGDRPKLSNGMVMSAIVARPDLSDVEVRVALLILRERNEETLECRIAERGIALLCGQKRYAVNRIIKKLIEKDILISKCDYDDIKKRKSPCYYFFMEDFTDALDMSPPLSIDLKTLKKLGAALDDIGMSHILDLLQGQIKDGQQSTASKEGQLLQ